MVDKYPARGNFKIQTCLVNRILQHQLQYEELHNSRAPNTQNGIPWRCYQFGTTLQCD